MRLPKCHICVEIDTNSGKDPKRGVDLCRLCQEAYCDAHKSKEHSEHMCEVDHQKYWQEHPTKKKSNLKTYSDLETREKDLGEEGVKIEDGKIETVVWKVMTDHDHYMESYLMEEEREQQ